MAHDPLALADALIMGGDLVDALAALDTALVEADRPPARRDEALRLRAAVLLRLGRHDEALASMAALAAPTDADHFQRSVMLEAAGDIGGALAALEAVDTAAFGRAVERRAALLIRADRMAEADALLAAQPADWRWLHWRADLAAQRGDLAAAAALYGDALADAAARIPAAVGAIAADQHIQLLCKRAACWRRLRRFAAARADMRAARALRAGRAALPKPPTHAV